MFHSIYLVTNNINGKIYIGQTKRNDRWYYHVWEANKSLNNMSLHKAIRKYGEGHFKFEYLLRGIFSNDIDKYETLFIKAFDSMNPNVGYNYLAGGGSFKGMYGEKNPNYGKKCPELSRRNKLRTGIPSSQKQKEVASITHKGKRKSIEQKKKMSDSRINLWASNREQLLTGAKKSGEVRKGRFYDSKICKRIKCNETDIEFRSARQAGIKMGFGQHAGNNISAQARGILRTAYGYTFKYI